MGINRIKLANGTQNMKNLQDARMQQTYQQNIADNQAQKIRNQGVLQAARNKLQNFGNTLTSGVEGAIDYSMPIVNLGKGLLTGAGEPIITDTMRQDLIQRAEAKGGNSGALGYEDYGLEANTGGRFAGGITDIINDPQAFANAATVGRVTYDRDPETGEYSFGDTNYDFNVEDTDTGLGANLLKGINEGGLTGAISNLLTPSTAAAAEPSAMPQGSPGQLNPTMADVAGPSIPEYYRNNPDNYDFDKFREAYAKSLDARYGEGQGGGTTTIGADGQIQTSFGNFDPSRTYQAYMDNTQTSSSRPFYEDIYGNRSAEEQAAVEKQKAMMASMYGAPGAGKSYFNAGGRVGLAEGTDLNLTARQVAEQNPELDAMRQNFFGANYLDDIDQGNTGTVQYYSGLGNPTSLNYTPPVVEEAAPVAVDTSTPIVDSGGDGGGGQATSGLDAGNNLGFDADVTPGPSGFIGLDPEYDVDPFEYSDYGTYDPTDTIADAPPSLGFGNAPTTLMDDREQYGAIGQYEDYVNPADVEAGLAKESMFDTPEQTNAIGNAFNSVKDLGIAGIDQLKDSLTAIGGKLTEGFDNTMEIGGRTIDLGKSLAGGVLSLATGIPGIGFVLNAINVDPRQTATKTALQERGYGFDDIGRLTTGPMAGYSVHSAFGDIAKATLDRIDKIENRTIAQTPASIAKIAELEGFLAELDYVGGDPIGANTDIDIATGNVTGDASVAEEAAKETRTEARNRKAGVETGDAGVAEAAAAADRAAADLAASNAASVSMGEARYGDGGPDGGGASNVEASSGDTYGGEAYGYNEAAEKSNDGGGSSGGGTHCCTAANQRGDMTLLEVKKLRVWHRKQSKIWQRGYDVWGRVMADNLVSKYKWSSDRVRDFYNHKIYGKRTIGSTFADFCIYPMSIIIGCILTVMPPILGYQKHD